MKQPTLKIYTRSFCGDCQSLKQFLKDHQVSFQQFELDHDSEKEEEMKALTGNRIVPTLVFTSSRLFKKKTEILTGFEQNKETIKKLLGIDE